MKYTSKFKINQEAFINENASSFYLLGAYMTDGCLHMPQSRIDLTSKDLDWLEAVRDLVSPKRGLNGPYKGSNCYSLKFVDKLIAFWLYSYGCTPHKSLTLTIAREIPPKYARDLMRGILDGDGSISIVRGNQILVDICSASRTFLDQLSQLIPKEISYHIYLRKQKENHIISGVKVISANPVYTLRINGRYAQQFLKWVYYPNHKLSMPRKYQKARDAWRICFGSKRVLSEVDVAQIKSLILKGEMLGTEIAKQFDVSKSSIYLIGKGHTWKGVQPLPAS